jgi:hypothetical protein
MRVGSISGSFEGGCGEGGQDGWPSGETAGDGAKGDFLGGARSPRPRIRAGRKPRHNMIMEGQANGRLPSGDMPGSSPNLTLGRAEPAPPRGGPSRARWPCGEVLEMTWKVILSEGRGLRVRIAMRCASRGTSSLSTSWPEAGGLAGPCVGQARAFPSGVRSPPLRGEAKPGGEALRGNAGDDAKGVFLGGTRSARPRGKAKRRPRHNIFMGGKRRPGGLEGTCPGETQGIPAGVRSPLLRGGPNATWVAPRGKTRG